MKAVFVLAIYTATAAAVLGHHSLDGVYDSSRQVTIEGVIRQFHFVNPHPYITVDVKTDGSMEQWRLEMDNRYELADIGITAETLKPGDRVVASGSPGRTQKTSLYIRKLDRPADGFIYEQIGSSPRIRVQPKKSQRELFLFGTQRLHHIHA